MNETYSLADLAAMSGLTDRTLRNYLKQGLLEGEKTDKGYRFTVHQIAGFFDHPAIVPALRAKKNGLVFDFLANRRKQQPAVCVVLDLPGTDGLAAERFCRAFNQSDADERATFSLEHRKGCTRVILTGQPEVILPLAARFAGEK